MFSGRRAVERVDGFLGGGGRGVGGFRVAVAKRGGVARGLRGPEIAGGVFVEGFERGGLVDVLAGGQDGGAEIDLVLCGHPVFVAGIDGLPDGKEAIDVDVMEPEDRIKSCVIDLPMIVSTIDIEIKPQKWWKPTMAMCPPLPTRPWI